jgi:hypothetical protein
VVSPRYQQLAISHQQSPSAFSASSACPELVEWAVKIYNPIKPETYRTTRSSVQICVISGYKEHTTKSQTLRPSVVQNLQPHQTRSQPHNPIIGANQCYRWFKKQISPTVSCIRLAHANRDKPPYHKPQSRDAVWTKVQAYKSPEILDSSWL